MEHHLKTLIFRHKRENLKKCSLRGLESRSDLVFYTYPHALPQLQKRILLTLDAPLLTEQDREGLLLVDGTWKYSAKIIKTLHLCICRSLPKEAVTAYPRKQTLCPDPRRGLASVEALFLAHLITKRNTAHLLDNYHWKSAFLEKNKKLIQAYTPST